MIIKNGTRAVTAALITASVLGTGIALAPSAGATTATSAVAVAKAQIGDPYKYGATGPNSFDCSGLTLYSYKKAGKRLTYKYKGKTYTARTARQQYNATTPIAYKNRKSGDLVFFTYKGTSNTHHVGIYIGIVNHRSTMIAAPYTGKNVRKEVIYSKYWEASNNISFGRVK
jgi:cell wall-associated NlpC family hydrolase